MNLTIRPVEHIGEIRPNCDLAQELRAGLQASGFSLEPRDILAVTQKVISKAEGRIRHLSEVTPSAAAVAISQESNKDPRLVEIILSETKRLVRIRGDVLICETHHGFICANAGVDRSNVRGGDVVTLLPRDADRSARHLAHQLGCGIIITDTFGRPWREGLLDIAIGTARVPLFIDFRGTMDTKGFQLHVTRLAAVDALAAAAGLVMGKTSGIPAALIRGFVWEDSPAAIDSMLRPAEKDLFR